MNYINSVSLAALFVAGCPRVQSLALGGLAVRVILDRLGAQFGASYGSSRLADSLSLASFVRSSKLIRSIWSFMYPPPIPPNPYLSSMDPYDYLMRVYETKDRLSVRTLFLSAGSAGDYNLGLRPTYDSFLNDRKELQEFAYRVVTSPLQICQQIASFQGPISELIISAHGDSQSMTFGENRPFSVFDRLPPTCFDNLTPDAQIVLYSCETGKNSGEIANLAQWVSWLSSRVVIAANNLVGPNSLISRDGSFSLQTEGNDVTVRYHASQVLKDRIGIEIAMIGPNIFRAITIWQLMRVLATTLQIAGTATVGAADLTSRYITPLIQNTRFYNVTCANILHSGFKAIGKVLQFSGASMHTTMDTAVNVAPRVIRKMGSITNLVLKTAFQFTANCASTIWNTFSGRQQAF